MMTLSKLLTSAWLLFLLAALPTDLLWSQKIDYSFGARVGFLMNKEDSAGLARNEANRIVLGPVFEVGWKGRFGLEVAPTFRPLDQRHSFDNSNVAGQVQLPPGTFFGLRGDSKITGFDWELPILGKYYFAKPMARLRPFLGYGVAGVRSQRRFVSDRTVVDSSGVQSNSRVESEFSVFRVGQAASAGLAWRPGNNSRFTIVPEVRYLQDRTATLRIETKNRLEFFLGFRF